MIRADSDKKRFDELVLELRMCQVHGSAIRDTVAKLLASPNPDA